MLRIYCTTLVALMTFINITNISINSWIVMAILAIPLIRLKRQEIPYALFFSIPFFEGLPYPKIIFVFIVKYLIHCRRNTNYQVLSVGNGENDGTIMVCTRRMKKDSGRSLCIAIGTVALFFALEIFTAVIYHKQWMNADALKYIGGYLLVLMIVLLMLQTNTVFDYYYALEQFCNGVFIACLLIVIRTYFISGVAQNAVSGMYRLGITVEKNSEGVFLTMNANTLAFYCGMSFFCMLVLRFSGYYKSRFQIIQMSVVFMCGIMTFCRTYLLAVMTVFFLYLSFAANGKKSKVITALLAGIAFLGALLLLLFSDNRIGNYFVERLQSDDIETGNGRTDQIKYYLSEFISNPKYMLFGSGVFDSKNVYQFKYLVHNAEVQILTCYGIPLAGWFIYLLLRPLRHMKGVNKVYWIPIIFSLLFFQTVHIVSSPLHLFMCMVAVACLKAGQGKFALTGKAMKLSVKKVSDTYCVYKA